MMFLRVGKILVWSILTTSCMMAAVVADKNTLAVPVWAGCTVQVRTHAPAARRVYVRGHLVALGVPILSGIRAMDTLVQSGLGGGAVIEPYFSDELTPYYEPETIARMRVAAPYVKVRFSQACDDQLLETVRQRLHAEAEVLSVHRQTYVKLAGGPSGELPLPAKRRISNDPDFGYQWGFDCPGQSGSDGGGCNPQADMKFLVGVRREPQYDVVVVNNDSGVYADHPDFSANRMWDDRFGLNVYDLKRPKFLADEFGHGTHTAGNYLMSGDNGKFGVGFGNSRVHHVTTKMFGNGSFSPNSVAVAAIWRTVDLDVKFKKAGLNVIVLSTNSWVSVDEGESEIPEMRAAVLAQLQAGIPFINAAGNGSENNDVRHRVVPAAWAQDTDFQLAKAPLIAVGASDGMGRRANFSGYGFFSTAVAAPGVNDYSTVPPANGNNAATNGSDLLYRFWQGTSMAAPKVAGAVAELLSVEGRKAIPMLRYRIPASSTKLSELAGLFQGGLLNFYELMLPDTQSPRIVTNIRVTDVSFNSATLQFTVPEDFSSDGSYRGGPGMYDLRTSVKPIRTNEDFIQAVRQKTPWPSMSGDRETLPLAGLGSGTLTYASLRSIDKGGNFVQVDLEPFRTKEAYMTWAQSSGSFIAADWILEKGAGYTGPDLWHIDKSGDLVYRVFGKTNYDTSDLGYTENGGIVWMPWQTLPGNPVLRFTSVRVIGSYEFSGSRDSLQYNGNSLGILVLRDGARTALEVASLKAVYSPEETDINLLAYQGQKVRIGFRMQGSLPFARFSGVAIKAVEIYGTADVLEPLPAVPNGGFEQGIQSDIANWLVLPNQWRYGATCVNCSMPSTWYVGQLMDPSDVREGQAALRIWNQTGDAKALVWTLSEPVVVKPRMLYQSVQALRMVGQAQVTVFGYAANGMERVLASVVISDSTWQWQDMVVPFAAAADTVAIRLGYALQGDVSGARALDADNVRLEYWKKVFSRK